MAVKNEKAKRKLPVINARDSWARVELWRWQYGELPGPRDMRPLNVPTGVRAMADALRNCDPGKGPNAANVIIVLEYLARIIEKQ